MSYYGVSVLITILVTSLVAFYLLYKAKELNLGIVISISIGSIILGFAFNPISKIVMNLLSDSIIINKKIALIISLLTVLFVFLLFILIISFIISFIIPKKLAGIDCCVIIDRIIAGIKIRDGIVNIKNKFTYFFKKNVSNIQKLVKNVYNSTNKLKKSVDTKQIIDTMGIEKNENVILEEGSGKSVDTPDSNAFDNLIAFMEPSKQASYTNQDSSIDTDIIEQVIEVNDSTYEDLAAVAYQELVIPQLPNIETHQVDEDEVNEDEVNENEVNENEVNENEVNEIEANEIGFNDLPEIIVEDPVAEHEIVEIDDTESEVPQIETIEDLSQTLQRAEEGPFDNISYAESISEPGSIVDADSLVLKAFESKGAGRKEDAIECYIEALQHQPSNEMLFWIVLDVCALYKQLGLIKLAKDILEGLVSEYGAAIQPEVKTEIMNYLK
jgi:hypothetical protein